MAVAAKTQGKMDTGVPLIEGESVERQGDPQVVYSDPRSSAAPAASASAPEESALALVLAWRQLRDSVCVCVCVVCCVGLSHTV